MKDKRERGIKDGVVVMKTEKKTSKKHRRQNQDIPIDQVSLRDIRINVENIQRQKSKQTER